MNFKNEFAKYYKSISNTELINILDNPSDFQQEALIAARNEFESRHLTDAEILEARKPLIEEKNRIEIKNEKIYSLTNSLETKFKIFGKTVWDSINPIQTVQPTTTRIIRFIVIVFSGIFLYNLSLRDGIIMNSLRDFKITPYESSILLLPFFILPIAIISFWKSKTIGWILFSVFIIFSIINVLWDLFFTITWKTSSDSYYNLFQRPPVFPLIIKIVFLIATQYVICKQKIREVYSISEKKMFTVIGVTGISAFFLTYVIF